MGLIKAALSSVSSGFGDQFKEFVECPQVENNVIIQRGVVSHGVGNTNAQEGIISNGSAIVVPQGMAAMIIDNGKIVEFTAEPGTFTWDTSSEPSIFTGGLGKGIIDTIKTMGNRITFGGQTAKDQRVYYVNTKTIPGLTFGSPQPEPIYDPTYGSVEITYNGEYALRIDDPAILINNVIGSTPKDTLTFDDIFITDNGRNMLKTKFAQKVSEAITKIMDEHNVSFNRIQTYKSDVTDKMNEILDSDLREKYGIIVEDVTLVINASEESKEIIRQVDAEISKTTRLGQTFANNPAAFAAANIDVMKTAAGNENGAMMGFMGMNMAANNGAAMMGAMNQSQQQTSAAQPQQTPVEGAKFCTNCGTPVTGKFCSNCGTQVQ